MAYTDYGCWCWPCWVRWHILSKSWSTRHAGQDSEGGSWGAPDGTGRRRRRPGNRGWHDREKGRCRRCLATWFKKQDATTYCKDWAKPRSVLRPAGARATWRPSCAANQQTLNKVPVWQRRNRSNQGTEVCYWGPPCNGETHPEYWSHRDAHGPRGCDAHRRMRIATQYFGEKDCGATLGRKVLWSKGRTVMVSHLSLASRVTVRIHPTLTCGLKVACWRERRIQPAEEADAKCSWAPVFDVCEPTATPTTNILQTLVLCMCTTWTGLLLSFLLAWVRGYSEADRSEACKIWYKTVSVRSVRRVVIRLFV